MLGVASSNCKSLEGELLGGLQLLSMQQTIWAMFGLTRICNEPFSCSTVRMLDPSFC